MNKDENKKKQMEAIKSFYINIITYITISVVCIVIWLSMGFGAFWPIWVILAFCVTTFIESRRIGVLPKMLKYMPFLNPEWGIEKMQHIFNVGQDEKNNSSKQEKDHSLQNKHDDA